MHRVHKSSVVMLMDIALSHREEPIVPQLPPDVPATILELDLQGLPTAAWPPSVEPWLLEASSASKEPPPRGTAKWALEPFTSRVCEIPCPIVSRRLRDHAERVANRASHLLNG